MGRSTPTHPASSADWTTEPSRSFSFRGLTSRWSPTELAELKLSELRRRRGGWDVLIAKSKTDTRGVGETLPLDHDKENGEGCDLICGACALDALINAHVGCYGRTLRNHARVFPSNLASGARWSTDAASRLLRRWWLDTGLNPDSRIGTRGIRAGTTTSLSQREVTLEDISKVTLHRGLAVLVRYIRRYDPVRWHYHLPL